MTKHPWMYGIGLGLATGAAIGLAMAPKKMDELKRTASRAMRTVGEAAENLSDVIEP